MASRLTEISLDCHDADLLAAFWTAALDWVVLDHEPGLVEIGPPRESDQALLDAVRSGPVPPTMFLAAVPDCRVELFEGAGHFPHLDDPDRFAQVLRDFMASA